MPTNILCRPSCFTMDRAVRMNSATLVSTPLLVRVAVSSSRVLMQSAGMEQTTAQAPAHAPAQSAYSTINCMRHTVHSEGFQEQVGNKLTTSHTNGQALHVCSQQAT